MTYIRIKSYYKNGTFTGCEHLYTCDDYRKAEERFYREYPTHRNCWLEVSFIKDDDPEWAEYIKVCYRCGVVN